MACGLNLKNDDSLRTRGEEGRIPIISNTVTVQKRREFFVIPENLICRFYLNLKVGIHIRRYDAIENNIRWETSKFLKLS
jgi:hypothetical protein